MQIYSVTNTLPKGHKKQLTISDGKKAAIYVQVPRFAPVGKGDQVTFESGHANTIYCLSAEDAADRIKVSPHFETADKASLGSLRIDARITEVNHPEDAAAFSFLEQFHYKSMTADEESGTQDELFLAGKTRSTSIGGRRAILSTAVGNWTPPLKPFLEHWQSASIRIFPTLRI
ncbi:MAG: hypothetical protein EOS07_18095 [Mesorhizobium sp.]|nr:MAG: hypothetical protein EOS07_18095 [Mesorhizobium sp.]